MERTETAAGAAALEELHMEQHSSLQDLKYVLQGELEQMQEVEQQRAELKGELQQLAQSKEQREDQDVADSTNADQMLAEQCMSLATQLQEAKQEYAAHGLQMAVPDLWLIVFRHLSPYQLCLSRRVNRWLSAIATENALWKSKIHLYASAMLCEPSSIALHSESTNPSALQFRRFGKCLDTSVSKLESDFNITSSLRLMGFAGKAASCVAISTGVPLVFGFVIVPLSHGMMQIDFHPDSDDDFDWKAELTGFLFRCALKLIGRFVWVVLRPLLQQVGSVAISVLWLLKSWRKVPKGSNWRAFVGTLVLAAAGFGVGATTAATWYGVFKLSLIQERYIARAVFLTHEFSSETIWS